MFFHLAPLQTLANIQNLYLLNHKIFRASLQLNTIVLHTSTADNFPADKRFIVSLFQHFIIYFSLLIWAKTF